MIAGNGRDLCSGLFAVDGSAGFLWQGHERQEQDTLPDLSWREIGLIIPLLFLMVYMGVYPRPILTRSENAVKAIQTRVMGQAGGSIEHAGGDTHSSVEIVSEGCGCDASASAEATH